MRLLSGDNRVVLPTLEANSFEACVTDPPYGLEFMGMAWDTFSEGAKGSARTRNDWGDFGSREHARHPSEQGRIMGQKAHAQQAFHEAWATEVYRVLKPGAHLAAFGGTRTFHRLACAIEDAGFEIRDTLCWLYGSGFPKSKNLEGDWDGWGSALKPAWEPIILARKPLAAANLQTNAERFGAGALNVDGCRLNTAEDRGRSRGSFPHSDDAWGRGHLDRTESNPLGRWPANVLLDEEAAATLDVQTGLLSPGGSIHRARSPKTKNAFGDFGGPSKPFADYGDRGGASRFFYCAKASRSEREAGLDALPLDVGGMRSETSGAHITRRDGGAPGKVHNSHPTVKPIALMRWLVRLVTPPGGTVLDPFMGSGSTGCAAAVEQFGFVGIEQHAPYLAIAEGRIRHWAGALLAEPMEAA